MIKISVVVPVYNVEQYLSQCLNSIGLFGRDDIEIILVNDGSTDGSRAICEEYAEKWNNISLINKENGGLSDARNYGTKDAQGEFIYYLDSDDWLVPGAIEHLYRFAVENDCEVVQGGFYYSFDDHLEYDDRWIKEDQAPFVMNRHDALRELLKNNYIKNFAWGKLYKSSIAKNHEFPFGKFYEDSYWQHHIVFETRRYGIIPKPLYYYRQRKSSISGSGGAKEMDLLEGLEGRLTFIRENYPELTSVAADSLWSTSFNRRNAGAKFSQFFERINSTYSSLCSKRLTRSMLYLLVNRKSSLLPAFLFMRRVYHHFIAKRLKRIEVSE